MGQKPYSDRRWYEAPGWIESECCTCQFDQGFAKCDKYPEGIPREILDSSFPGTEEYKKKYCKYRKKAK